MTLPALSHDQHLLLGALLVALGALLVAVLWLRHLARNQQRIRAGQPPKSLAGHLATHPGKHASALVVAIIGVVLLVTAGTAAYVLLHHGGFKAPPGLHKAPPVRHSAGGSGVNYTSVDLAASVRPVDAVDQGNSESCCGWTLVRLDALNRYLRDKEVVTTAPPISGFKPWWYVTGGQNVGTSPDDEAAQYNAHGAEGLAYWGRHGVPDGTDAAHTLPIAGTSVTWDYYQDSGAGRAGLNDIEWRLDHGQPQGVVWAVHQGGLSAQNADFTWDGGNFIFMHCLVAVQYTRNYPGIGEAVRLWNSWGTSYGRGGYIWVPAQVFMSHIVGDFTEVPGPPVAAWLPPTPTSTPVSLPTARPTATPKPAVCFVQRLTLTRSANLHAAARPGTPAVVGVAKGQVVLTLCPAQTAPGWVRVRAGTRVGWLSTAAL